MSRDDEIRRLEQQVKELERLRERKESGEATPEDLERLSELAEQGRQDVAASLISSAVALAVVVVALVWWFSGSDDPQPRDASKAESEPDYRLAATGACQEYVRRSLKAPSTAEFLREGRSAREETEGMFRVTGYVDAQNSFGVMLRQRYQCRVFLSGGDWFLDDISITD